MAIQVNGTTVIDNSRNLTNITSVDATTAAAIGNAGVGGGFTLLSTTTFSGTYSNIDLTLDSGYNVHRLVFSFPVPNTSWNGLWFQMMDSSNNVISSSVYDYAGTFSGSSNGDRQAGASMLTGNYHNNSSGSYIMGHMDIHNARNSGRYKQSNAHIIHRSLGYMGNTPDYARSVHQLNYTNVCNKIRIFGNGSNLSTQSGRTDYVQVFGA